MHHYRREIDGLRAIAVIAVMLYHANVPLITGGYIGVDVFFVISGFLITGILVRQYEMGTLRLADFWVRRAKRILPALLVVLVFSVTTSLFFLAPPALEQFGKSLASGSTFSSNIFFWRDTASYFDPNVHDMLLIHLWSLSVEEQFYIFYPWIVIGILRFCKRYLALILAIGLGVSLVLSIYMAGVAPRANFYLPPPRAWELLTGALADTYRTRAGAHITARPRLADLLTGISLLLILGPVFLYDDLTSFPGMTAIPPVLGTALILTFARPEAGAGRLLASTPFVAIGLISYSAYLWHQPLLALGNVYSFANLGWVQKFGLVVLACLLAWLSYIVVEGPLRHARVSASKVALWAIGAQLLTAAAGIILWMSAGLPGRLPRDIVDAATSAEQGETRMAALFLGSITQVDQPPILGRQGPVDIAVLGDSHGGAMATGLNAVLAKSNRRAAVFLVGGVMPGMTVAESALRQREGTTYLDAAVRKIVATPNLRTVILSARWTLYFHGSSQYRDDGGLSFRLADAHAETMRVARLRQSLSAMVKRLLSANKQVILVYPVPELPYNLPEFVAGSFLRGGEQVPNHVASLAHFYRVSGPTFAVLNGLDDSGRIVKFYPHAAMCDARSLSCATLQNGKFLYTDDNHLSPIGAERAFLPMVSILKRR